MFALFLVACGQSNTVVAKQSDADVSPAAPATVPTPKPEVADELAQPKNPGKFLLIHSE